MSRDGGEAGRRYAAGVAAVGSPAELARSNPCRQDGGNHPCGPGEYAFIRRIGRIRVRLDQTLRQGELGIPQPQREEVGDGAFAIGRPQPLVRDFTDLRCVEAHPDFFDLRALRPEREKLVKVAGPRGQLARRRAMHGDCVALDVFENAIVGRGCAADVMLRLQAVDRHDNREAAEFVPVFRDLPHRTGHELGVDAARGQSRQQHVQLAKSHQRLAPDD